MKMMWERKYIDTHWRNKIWKCILRAWDGVYGSSNLQGVSDYTIYLGREIKWTKKDKVRARAKCKEAECPSDIFCSYSEVYTSFQVKTYKSNHVCGGNFKDKQETMKWLWINLQRRFELNYVTCIEPYEYTKREFRVHVDDTKIFRVIKDAREIVEDSEMKQYRRIIIMHMS